MRRIVCLLLLFILLPTMALSENLLYNPGFEELSGDRPVGWQTDAWLFDTGVTYFDVTTPGRGGGTAAQIENVASNDARYVQEVAVEADSVYRLSGYVRAGISPETGAGANLSVLGQYADFPEAFDTQGEWALLEVYIGTHSEQKTLTIAARLGTYGGDNSGAVAFDDLALEKVEAAPADAAFFPMTRVQNTPSTPANTPTVRGFFLEMLLWAILCFVLWRLRDIKIAHPKWTLALLLAAAFLLRVYFALTQVGYETDMACFFAWSNRMVDIGPGAFYQEGYFCDYPPGYLYILWFNGGLLNLLNLQTLAEPLTRVVLRLVPMLCDMGIAYAIYRFSKKQKAGDTLAILLATAYALNPAVLVNSAVWGQVDSVLAFCLVLTVLFAMENRWRWALPLFVLGVLLKPQALMAGPLGLAFLLVGCVKKQVCWKDALAGIGLSIAVAALVLVPFLWGKPEPIAWIWAHYGETLSSYAYATVNAPNLFYLLGANWVATSETVLGIPYSTLGTVFTVIIVALSCVRVYRKNDINELPLLGALTFLGIFLFSVQMHERYLFPAIALLALAIAVQKDRRLLWAFLGLSASLFAGTQLVLRDTHLALGIGAWGAFLAIANFACFALMLYALIQPTTKPLPPSTPLLSPVPRFSEEQTPPWPPMFRWEWLALAVLTLGYACVAFIGLGDTIAPQQGYQTSGTSETIVVDLGRETSFQMLYYAGISQRGFTVSLSVDGETFDESLPAKLGPGDCFRWLFLTSAILDANGDPVSWMGEPITLDARYVQLTFNGPGVSVTEIGLRDLEGELLPITLVSHTGQREGAEGVPEALLDEQFAVVTAPSYLNGTYFDEIYHARTGYEHANGLQTYEWTHPPLGKIFIMWGIQLFGMTAFGWRFFGALMGVLMIPALYFLAKLLFKKGRWAFLAAFLMAFDMMHLTQTRIATIDSYAVLFIILMCLFMFRFLQMNLMRDGFRCLIPLGLSGLMMGLGCASKWICFYAGAGLAVLFFWGIFKQFRQWRRGVREGEEAVGVFPMYLMGTLACCLVFFIAIPFAIYYFSYIPQFRWEGGLTFAKFWRTQVNIYNYHANLVDDHAFQSAWYEWPLSLKPMYYYNGKPFIPAGTASTIMTMGNLAVWWVGLCTMVYTFYRAVKAAITHTVSENPIPVLLVIAFLAQFLPWVLVPRSTFIYHYFGSLPFVISSIVYAFYALSKRKPRLTQKIQWGYMAVVVLFFIAFYPVATGVVVPEIWIKSINWLSFLRLPGWQFTGWIFY